MFPFNLETMTYTILRHCSSEHLNLEFTERYLLSNHGARGNRFEVPNVRLAHAEQGVFFMCQKLKSDLRQQ